MKVLYRILQFLMIDHAFALVFILVTGMEGTSDEMTMILLALAPSFLFLAVATAVIRSVMLRFRCTECKTVFKPDRKERFLRSICSASGACTARVAAGKNGARALSDRLFKEEKL